MFPPPPSSHLSSACCFQSELSFLVFALISLRMFRFLFLDLSSLNEILWLPALVQDRKHTYSFFQFLSLFPSQFFSCTISSTLTSIFSSFSGIVKYIHSLPIFFQTSWLAECCPLLFSTKKINKIIFLQFLRL